MGNADRSSGLFPCVSTELQQVEPFPLLTVCEQDHRPSLLHLVSRSANNATIFSTLNLLPQTNSRADKADVQAQDFPPFLKKLTQLLPRSSGSQSKTFIKFIDRLIIIARNGPKSDHQVGFFLIPASHFLIIVRGSPPLLYSFPIFNFNLSLL